MSKSGDLDWPPRSPDLTPPDFFLWNIEDNIREEIAAILAEMLAKTMENAARVRRIWATLYIILECKRNKLSQAGNIIFHEKVRH